MRSSQVLGCVIAFAFFVPGCRWQSDPVGPPVETPAVEFDVGPNLSLAIDGNEVHITPGDATSAPREVLPEDVPIFPDAVVSLAAHSPHGGFVSYSVLDAGYQVRKFYVDQLSSGGWQLTSQKNSDFTHELAATKAGRELYILIDAIEGGTQVTLSHRRADDGG